MTNEEAPGRLWVDTLRRKQNPTCRRPMLCGGSLYVSRGHSEGGGLKARLSCLDGSNGVPRWHVDIDHLAGAPLRGEGGTCLWAGWDGSLRGISEDGEIQWKTDGLGGSIFDPVAVRSGVIAVGEGDGQVSLLCSRTGDLQWRVNVDDVFGCDLSQIVACESHVLLRVRYGSFDTAECGVIALDYREGQVAWKRLWAGEISGHFFMWRGALHIFVAGAVQVLDPETGEQIGSLLLPADCAPQREPLVVDDRLFLCAASEQQGWACAYEEGDSEWARSIWQRELQESVGAVPVIAGDHLALLGGYGRVFLLDSRSGEMVQSFIHARAHDVGGLATDGESLIVAHGRTIARYALA